MLILTISLCACGSSEEVKYYNSPRPTVTPAHNEPPAELSVYVDSFMNWAESAGVSDARRMLKDIALLSDNDPSWTSMDVVGYCDSQYYPYATGNVGLYDTNYVRLKASPWANLSDTERYEVVWHELGHCVLGLAHVSASANRADLMNPVMHSPWEVEDILAAFKLSWNDSSRPRNWRRPSEAKSISLDSPSASVHVIVE
jgi:hypothetical protein